MRVLRNALILVLIVAALVYLVWWIDPGVLTGLGGIFGIGRFLKGGGGAG